MSKINSVQRAVRIALAAACTVPGLAAAQAASTDTTQSAPQPAQGLEQIVVTAQKVSQNLQTVPVAISAFNADDLRNRQAFGLNDVKYLVPGLYVEQNFSNPSTPSLFIRGVGEANAAFTFTSPIGVYVDDVYYPRLFGSMVDFFDVDRIEVLRGPQGIIYGRNSSVGAIRVVTQAAPLDTMDAQGDVTYGSEDTRNARVTVGLPIVNDEVGLRISFNSKYNRGFQVNTTNGERTDSEDSNAVRAQLLTKFNDNLSLTLRGDFMRDDSRPPVAEDFKTTSLNSLQYQSELSYGLGSARARVETFGASATVNWQLEGAKLTSISAWRGVNTLSGFDADGTTDPNFEEPHNDLIDRSITQEVYGTGERLFGLPVSWVSGIFLLHEKTGNLNALEIFGPPYTLQDFTQQTNSAAAYMQGSWHVTEKLSVTGGTRYTTEHKNFEANSTNPDGSFNFHYANNDLNTIRWTWRGDVNYQFDAPVLLYASIATGFRSGGLNGQATAAADITGGAVQPEDTRVFEIGEKSELWDHRVRLNVDYYFGRYDHLQDTIVLSNGAISTANNTASVDGLELEGRWLALPGLELSATLATLHDTIANSNAQLPYAPKLTDNLAASYSHGLGSAGTGTLAVSYNHTGSSFQDSQNTPVLLVHEHDNIDAHATFATPDDHWRLTFAGQNLTNKIYSLGGFYIFNGLIASAEWPSLPRRWTFSAQYRY